MHIAGGLHSRAPWGAWAPGRTIRLLFVALLLLWDRLTTLSRFSRHGDKGIGFGDQHLSQHSAGAFTRKFAQGIVNGLRLTECDDSGISRHGVSLYVATVDDNIPDIDADAKFDPPLLRHVGITLHHAALDIN